MMNAEEAARSLPGECEYSAGRWWACCPAHPDEHPSLTIQDGGDKLLIICRSGGCTFDEICRAAGWKPAELFRDPLPNGGRNRVRPVKTETAVTNETFTPGPRGREAPAEPSANGHKPATPRNTWTTTGWKKEFKATVDLAGTPGEAWLAARGIPLEVARAAGLRYSPSYAGRPAITLELRDYSKSPAPLVCGHGRHTDGKEKLPAPPGKKPDPKCHNGGEAKDGMYDPGGGFAALDRGDPVFLVEGPMCAISLKMAGFFALSPVRLDIPKWFSERCRGKTIYVALDNDASGIKFAEKHMASLRAAGAFPIRLTSNEKDWNDDHVALGLEAFRAKVEEKIAAAVENPETDDNSLRGPGGLYHLSDVGNAHRFLDQRGEHVHYCAERGKWVYWRAGFWNWDNVKSLSVRMMAEDTALKIRDEPTRELSKDEYSAHARHAITSQSSGGLSNMLGETQKHVSVRLEEFDADPMLLKVVGQTLDLATCSPRPDRQEDLITLRMGTSYDPAAKCPVFDRFFAQILPDPEVQSFLLRAFGSALTGIVRDRKIFFCIGRGANGKTTLFELIAHIWGDYAIPMDAQLIYPRIPGRINTEIPDLRGKRMAWISETGEGARLDENMLKKLASGGEKIHGRKLYEEDQSFVPTAKLFLLTNHQPTIRDTSPAIRDRLCYIPFGVRIEEADRDLGLLEKLKAEAPAVLARIEREGFIPWRDAGRLIVPKVISDATTTYLDGEDLLGTFIKEACLVGPPANLRCGVTPFRQAYDRFDVGNDISATIFRKRMEDRGFEQKNSGGRYYPGIALIEPEISEVY